MFTPGETNCACTILLNLSTTLPRLHSLMSFRSGGPGHGRNEVWTGERDGCTRASGMRAGVECAGSVFARICILFAVV